MQPACRLDVCLPQNLQCCLHCSTHFEHAVAAGSRQASAHSRLARCTRSGSKAVKHQLQCVHPASFVGAAAKLCQIAGRGLKASDGPFEPRNNPSQEFSAQDIPCALRWRCLQRIARWCQSRLRPGCHPGPCCPPASPPPAGAPLRRDPAHSSLFGQGLGVAQPSKLVAADLPACSRKTGTQTSGCCLVL